MSQRAHAWKGRKNLSFSSLKIGEFRVLKGGQKPATWYHPRASKNPIPHQKHHTRENQASAHGKIKCTLNRRGSQNPVSIKTPTRPSVHPWHPKALPRVRPPYQPPTSNQQPICPESFWSPFIMLNTVDTIDKMATGYQTTKTNVYNHGPQTTLH